MDDQIEDEINQVISALTLTAHQALTIDVSRIGAALDGNCASLNNYKGHEL